MPEKEFKKLSNDTIFKLVFSDEEIMIWFLEKIFKKKIKNINIFNGQDGQPITEQNIIELIKQELEKENINVKTKIVDLLVKINNDIYNIEYNNTYDKDTKKRNFAYISNIYANSLKKKEDYIKQPICTQINLCSKINEGYKKEINYIKGEKNNKKFINNMNIYEFNIAEYKKMLYTDNKKLIKENLHLIMFDCDDKELEMLEEYDNMVKKIRKLVNKYNDDSTIYQFLTTEEDQEKMTRTRIIRAEQRGLEQGKKQGISQGIEQGISQGIEQGIELTKAETACSLLKEKIPLDIIARATGYTQEYLQTIKI